MIGSILIVGGNKEKRWEKATQIAQEKLETPSISTHPDFLLIEGKNSISITQIRNLEGKIALKPYIAKMKIALINEAEKLTLPAQNALLKTLEEPPKHTLIILTAPGINFLLPTIVSRCQLVKLKITEEVKPEIYLQGKRVGERLKIAALYSQNKNQAKEFCERLLLSERQAMLKNPNRKKARNIHYILETILMIEKNINPTLATGNLLLKLL